MLKRIFWLGSLLFLSLLACSVGEKNIHFAEENGRIIFESPKIKIKIDNQMRCNVYRKSGDSLLSIIRATDVPFYVVINDAEVKQFELKKDQIEQMNLKNEFGGGRRLKLVGTANGPSQSVIEKVLYIDIYDQFPEAALMQVEYRNVNSTPGLVINKEVDNHFKLDASLLNTNQAKNDFWILQGGSYRARPDWILPVTDDFSFENYQGPQVEINEVGGGLPVLDVWCKETGFFIGSLREKPTLISLPAHVDDEGFLDISIKYNGENMKFESEPYRSIPTVIGVHDGDFYNGLRTYSKLMERKGLKMLDIDPADPVYEAIWCGWGFGPDFTMKQMYDMIPILKEYNFKVVTVDMGWFYHNGDYIPRDDTFPNGDEDMRKFVQTFHDNGFKIKLWVTWSIAGPKLQQEHPEWLLRDENDNPVYFYNYNCDVAYLCPALKEVQKYYRELVRKFIGDWGYDGFKVDQQIINAVTKCYAKNHFHDDPAESFEALPDLYKLICEETLKLKPDAIIEVCPCGVFPSFYKMPYYNQPVSSDFKTQWQIRHRGKVIKGLMGPRAAFYGDHVERFYKEVNFTSMIGVGGIPGTMSVAREEDNYAVLKAKYPGYISPEKKKHFKKWLGIYQDYPLSKGEYLNLYDIAYDKPEAHVVNKDGMLHYAFFAHEWDGKIELRGLENKPYTIIDYVNNREVGKISGNGKLNVQFEEYLLVKAVPESK